MYDPYTTPQWVLISVTKVQSIHEGIMIWSVNNRDIFVSKLHLLCVFNGIQTIDTMLESVKLKLKFW